MTLSVYNVGWHFWREEDGAVQEHWSCCYQRLLRSKRPIKEGPLYACVQVLKCAKPLSLVRAIPTLTNGKKLLDKSQVGTQKLYIIIPSLFRNKIKGFTGFIADQVFVEMSHCSHLRHYYGKFSSLTWYSVSISSFSLPQVKPIWIE